MDMQHTLEEIVITEELRTRSSKVPNFELENASLRKLAKDLARSPETILKSLVEEAAKVCKATSAGISLSEELEGNAIFRWQAVTGDLKKFLHATMPADFSPCGVVVERKSVLLLANPVRYYSYMADLGTPIAELLLVPFYLHEKIRGTIWVVSACATGKFDIEDARILHSLAEFASAAVQTQLQLEKQWESKNLLETTLIALRTEKQKFEAMIKESPAAIGLMRGPYHVFEIVNENWRELVSRREYLGRSYADIYPELVDTPAHKSIDSVYNTGESFETVEMKLLVQTSPSVYENRYYDYTCVRIDDGEGKPYGVFCHALNVTDRVNARKKQEEDEDRIRQSEERLSNAIAVSKVGFYDWDMIADKVSFSDQMRSDWQIESGANLAEVLERVHSEDRQETTKLIKASIQNRSPYSTEFRIKLKDKSTIWIQIQGRVTYASDGRPLRFFGTSIDISEQKLIQISLKNAKEEAERANAAKSSFLANMSHEIRTPVGAIMGFASLLQDQRMSTEDQSNYLSIIERNSHHLLKIIDDVLDLAKVESGKIALEMVRFSLVEFFADFSSSMEFRARENGIFFEFEAVTALPEFVISDPTRIRQILSNIVVNAIKFTERGRVDLRVSYQDQSLVFRVTDTGRGISPEQCQRLFQAFTQADASTTRKFGGTGLGLVLTKKLSQALGGDFFLVESTLGKGSVFESRVSVQESSHAQLVYKKSISAPSAVGKFEISNSPNLTGMNILLVEDSPDNLMLIQRFLSLTNANVVTANDGVEGTDKALKQLFDVVLMDIQMPNRDGHEAVRILRSKGYKAPVIALTAHAMADEQERSLASGFSHFLSKPISRHALYELLLSLWTQSKQGYSFKPHFSKSQKNLDLLN